MNTAQKGAAYEREVRKMFEDAGYSVIRGAGSKGEVFGMKADLVATKAGKMSVIVIIQCKRSKGIVAKGGECGQESGL